MIDSPGISPCLEDLHRITNNTLLQMLFSVLFRLFRPSPKTRPATRKAKPKNIVAQADNVPSRTAIPSQTAITGKAYVIDGDSIKVAGQEIGLAGLDAPEWGQLARHQQGYWLNHGQRVKSALIREIGGQPVRVTILKMDRYGRSVGPISCAGKDVGEWLVRNGCAVAMDEGRYKQIERKARKEGRGMWGHAVAYYPSAWRHERRRRLN